MKGPYMSVASVLFLIVAMSVPLDCSGESRLPVQHGPSSGNLAELLRFVAQNYKVPLIAELANPIPQRVVLDSGQDTLSQVLDKLLTQAPNYTAEIVGGNVVHFYRRDVLDARGNLLTIRIQHFAMPANLSDFKLLLPATISNARQGLPAGGAVISGFPSTEMEKAHLSERVVDNVCGRELLLRAAQETHAFYTIVVFEDPKCTSDHCFDYANQHWFWGLLNGALNEAPIYIQAPSRN
jgi:hypothetical protein